MKTRTLAERCNRLHVSEFMTPEFIARAELQRVARQVRKIRKEVAAPTCEVDAGYKTALNDVLALLKEATR